MTDSILRALKALERIADALERIAGPKIRPIDLEEPF